MLASPCFIVKCKKKKQITKNIICSGIVTDKEELPDNPESRYVYWLIKQASQIWTFGHDELGYDDLVLGSIQFT